MIKYARSTVSLREPGSKYPTSVHIGQPWHADHPIVVHNPDQFADEPTIVFPRDWVPAEVEQATAAPGERRNARRAG